MRSRYRAILFLILFLIIAAGIAAFVFRQPLASYLSDQTELEEPIISSQPSGLSASEALDVSLFNAPAFTSLKSQLVNFDFENICRRRAGQALQPAGATSSAVSDCVVGNSLPFVRPADN